MPRTRWRLLLWVMVICALLVRLWGTWYGLPFTYYNDEYHEVMRALQLGTGSFNFERNGKGGLYFILFFEYAVYFVVLKLAGVIDSAQEFGKLFARDPTVFYMLGRVTVAVLGALTVAAIFHLTRLAYSLSAGLLAALFLSANVLHIDLSRLIGLDVMMTLLATVALYFALRMIETRQRKDYLWAALFAALATTTKIPAILLLVPLLIAHTYVIRATRAGPSDWIASRNLWYAVLVFAGVLVATNPGIVNITDYFDLFVEAPDDAFDDAGVMTTGMADVARRPNLYVYYLDAIRASMGWPLFASSIVALGYALWRRTPADVVLVSYGVVTYVSIASTTSGFVYFPRYTLPIIVVLLALAARAFAEVLDAVPSRRGVFATASLVVLMGVPVKESVSSATALTEPDSRTLALEWFEANVPSGVQVLIEGGKISPMRSTVPLQDTVAAMQRRIEYWKQIEPKQAKLLEYRIAVHDGGGYDLEIVQAGTVASLDEYVAKGVEYFVVRPDVFVGSRKAGDRGPAFLMALRSDPRIRLVKRFVGTDESQLSPTIEIYRLDMSLIERDSSAHQSRQIAVPGGQ